MLRKSKKEERREDGTNYRVYKQKEVYLRYEDGEAVESAGGAEEGEDNGRGRRKSEGGQQGQIKKRFRQALWEICKFQKSTFFLIRKIRI